MSNTRIPTPHAGKPKPQKSTRMAQLAQIHIAKKQLGLSDADYRHVLQVVCGVDSSALLSARGCHELLLHFKKLGFQPKHTGGRGWVKERGAVKDTYTDQQLKILALWRELHASGHVRSNTEGALMAWVKREFKVDHLRWLHPAQCHTAIERLKLWLARPVRQATPARD